MPWRQHDNVDLLRDMAAHCSYVASCTHGWDLFKSWAFCASFEEIISIACTCQHPVGTHKSIAGAKSNGTYLSHGPRSTRLRLRNNLPLAWPVTPHPWDTRMQTSQTLHSFFREEYIPHRPRLRDGAGLNSTADHTHQSESTLRMLEQWMTQENRMEQILHSLADEEQSHSLSDEQQAELLELAHSALHPQCKRTSFCDISQGQPFRLGTVQTLARCVKTQIACCRTA